MHELLTNNSFVLPFLWFAEKKRRVGSQITKVHTPCMKIPECLKVFQLCIRRIVIKPPEVFEICIRIGFH